MTAPEVVYIHESLSENYRDTGGLPRVKYIHADKYDKLLAALKRARSDLFVCGCGDVAKNAIRAADKAIAKAEGI